jgi:hypothetical protein
MVGVGQRHERPGHRLVEPARGRGAAQAPHERWAGSGGRRATPSRAAGRAGDPVEPEHAGRTSSTGRARVDVGAPGRRGLGPIRGDGETEPVEDRLLLVRRDLTPPCRPAQDGVVAFPWLRLAVDRPNHLDASPPQVSMISAVSSSRPGSRNAGSTPRSNRVRASEARPELAPGHADPLGIEVGDLEQHVGGRRATPECSPPMIPAMSCTPLSSAITVIEESSV